MEKECIGCYVSGNPLDDYKKAIERAVTLKSSNIQRIAEEQKASQQRRIAGGAKPWQLRDSTKSYTALGMLTDLHQIRTKKGDDMAFAKLSDLTGQIDCTFFPKVWGTLRNQLEPGNVYAFCGKVDTSRDTPSLLVDTMEDAKVLENHSIKAVHILMDKEFKSEGEIQDLKNFLFAENGNCSVYFHIDAGNNPYVVKANDQLHMNAEKETIQQLKELAFVKDVWLE